MGPRSVWPGCVRCRAPMLFRAQLPLTSTCLVPFDDERLLLVFECHARPRCPEGAALVVRGPLEPREPPYTCAAPVVLEHESGGALVPFDDEPSGCSPLPTLAALRRTGAVRALLGPRSDHAPPHYGCEGRLRPAAHLLGEAPRGGMRFAPTSVHVCLTCDAARIHRHV